MLRAQTNGTSWSVERAQSVALQRPGSEWTVYMSDIYSLLRGWAAFAKSSISLTAISINRLRGS